MPPSMEQDKHHHQPMGELDNTTAANTAAAPPSVGDEEYRRRCRQFYRKSTSVVDDSEDEDEDDDKENTTTTSTTHENRIVLEAVDKLSQCHSEDTSAYTSFLKTLSSSQLSLLASCNLPTSMESLQSFDDITKLITIRSEERKAAHEVNMQQRLNVLRKILLEENSKNDDKENDDDDAPPTKNAVTIRPMLRHFVTQYQKTNIASHSLMAGMRHVLERQLDSTHAKCLAWSFDAAVISEAVMANEDSGASQQYMKDAVSALLSFMVYDNSQVEEAGNSSTLVFYVDPTLSDRTILEILRELPRNLDARPTGKISTNNENAPTRTNIEGDLDGPRDNVCSAVMKQLFGHQYNNNNGNDSTTPARKKWLWFC